MRLPAPRRRRCGDECCRGRKSGERRGEPPDGAAALRRCSWWFAPRPAGCVGHDAKLGRRRCRTGRRAESERRLARHVRRMRHFEQPLVDRLGLRRGVGAEFLGQQLAAAVVDAQRLPSVTCRRVGLHQPAVPGLAERLGFDHEFGPRSRIQHGTRAKTCLGQHSQCACSDVGQLTSLVLNPVSAVPRKERHLARQRLGGRRCCLRALPVRRVEQFFGLGCRICGRRGRRPTFPRAVGGDNSRRRWSTRPHPQDLPRRAEHAACWPAPPVPFPTSTATLRPTGPPQARRAAPAVRARSPGRRRTADPVVRGNGRPQWRGRRPRSPPCPAGKSSAPASLPNASAHLASG